MIPSIRKAIVACLVFLGACLIAHFIIFEILFLKSRDTSFLAPFLFYFALSSPVLLALLYASLSIKNWSDCMVISVAVGLTATLFLYGLGLLHRPGYHKIRDLEFDLWVQLFVFNVFVVLVVFLLLWGIRRLIDNLLVRWKQSRLRNRRE